MAQEKGRWVTIEGRHIFIRDGESVDQAVKRAYGVDQDADEKERQIENNKKQAAELNEREGKPTHSADDDDDMFVVGGKKKDNSVTQGEILKWISDEIEKLREKYGWTPAGFNMKFAKEHPYSKEDAERIGELYRDTRIGRMKGLTDTQRAMFEKETGRKINDKDWGRIRITKYY
jgi:hypothetical protein